VFSVLTSSNVTKVLRSGSLSAAAIAVSAFVALTAASTDANAIPQFRFTDGSATVDVSDNQFGMDFDLRPGIINWAGTVGSFNTVVGIGATKPHIGTATMPEIDMLSLQISGTAGGTLQVMFTETDFLGDGNETILSGIGGTTNGTVVYETYTSLTNNPFATDILLSSSGTLGGLAFSFEDTVGAEVNGPYSLTTVVTVTHTAGGLNTSFNAAIEISAPGAAPVFVTGLLAAAAIRRRKNRKNA
jgi:hypothetical protein